MSGPATPVSLKRVPCDRCGSLRATRWMINGEVQCLGPGACADRASRKAVPA